MACLSSGAEYARYLSLLYSVAVSLQLFLPALGGEEDDNEAPTPVAEPPDDEDDDSWREDCFDALGLLGAISAGVPSGEAESELARLSKSSRRRFNFLPMAPKKKEKELIFTEIYVVLLIQDNYSYTYGSCAGQFDSGSDVSQQDLKFWSSPH